MTQLTPSIAGVFLFASLTASLTASTVLQEWNFTEDGSGLSNRLSEQGLNSQHFDDPDPVTFDGGHTVITASGFSGDRQLGITLDDTNTSTATISVTLSSFDFSNGVVDDVFGVRFREDATNTTIADLGFKKQDANTRVRLLGTAVAGVALDAESSASSFTYGMTLDFENDTYTYWIGTPESDNSTWVSRFAAHTGSISGLGTGGSVVDSVQFYTTLDTGNSYVLDQIQVSYTGIPEPSIGALFGALAMTLGVARRR